jgi:hypothetical protein
MAPIRCDPDQVQLASFIFPCQVVDFPMKYLGIPISVTTLLKFALQPLVDKVANRLPAWKGRLKHHSGQLVPIKTTLAAIPVYISISLRLPPWLIKALVKIM